VTQTHRTSLCSDQTNVDLSLLQASTLLKYFIIFADVEGQDSRTEFLHNYNAKVRPSSAIVPTTSPEDMLLTVPDTAHARSGQAAAARYHVQFRRLGRK
jgi:hypothetical protein